MCSKVLFPVPDSPTMASISPVCTCNDKFSKSTKSELPERNTFFRFSARNKHVLNSLMQVRSVATQIPANSLEPFPFWE